MGKIIYLAGDHAGFELKKKIEEYLTKKKIKWIDLGPLEYNPKDDYPDFVMPLAKIISKKKNSVGIVIAGSGQGEAIEINKIKGVRAALYHGGSSRIVKTGREHDNTNILCFGSRFVKESEAKKAINIFLKTRFAKGRHERRVKKVGKYGQVLK